MCVCCLHHAVVAFLVFIYDTTELSHWIVRFAVPFFSEPPKKVEADKPSTTVTIMEEKADDDKKEETQVPVTVSNDVEEEETKEAAAEKKKPVVVAVEQAPSNNAFASGSHMNSGNVLTERPSSRVLAPPGGHCSIKLG